MKYNCNTHKYLLINDLQEYSSATMLQSPNAGLRGKATRELALPGGCFLVQFLAKSQKDYIYRSKGKNDISDIDGQPAGKKLYAESER